jgi:hypothetical protein
VCVYFIQHCFIFRPTNFTVSEDAGIKPWIEPRTVVTLALAVRRSNVKTAFKGAHIFKRLWSPGIDSKE